MITRRMVDALWCPTCREGGLALSEGRRRERAVIEGTLTCEACDRAYPIRGGIPALFPHGQLGTEGWRLWKEHLEKFEARRSLRKQNPEKPLTRWGQVSRPHRAFADFIGVVPGGRVLDLGCGPGKFRFKLEGAEVRYYGLDPIALVGAEDFPFVKALAEAIPFREGFFTDVVVLAALDHFRDLERVFEEVSRVLTGDGKFHVLQSVHDVRGPVSLVKVAGHKLKDALEDRQTKRKGEDASVPKHLSEFSTPSLLRRLDGHFEVVATERYDARWYAPTRLFVSSRPAAVSSTRSARSAGRPGRARGAAGLAG